MPKVVFYTRASSEEQKNGYSHEYQIEGLRRTRLLTSGGYEEFGNYSDTVTGKEFDNRASGLDLIYKLCEKNRGLIDYLFIHRWDRLGRDVGDCFQCIKRFKKLGVEVNCPEEWATYKDPTWTFFLGIKFAQAQSESLRISDRTTDGLHQAVIMGFWPYAAPVGYLKGEPRLVNGKERKVCEIHPELGPLVKQCFEAYSTGTTKAELFALHGEKLGVKKSQFLRMFHNPFYTGVVYVKAHREQPAQVVDGAHEALVSRELFDTCLKIKESGTCPTLGKTWSLNPDVIHTEFWLKGILKSLSGRNMTAYKSKGRRGGRFGYYSEQKTKGGQIIPSGRAHHIVTQALSSLKITEEMRDEIRAEARAQIAERVEAARRMAEAAKAGLAKAKKRLENIRIQFGDGDITAKEYRTLKADFERDTLDNEAKIIQAEAMMSENDDTVEKVVGLLSSIDLVFSVSSPDYKGQILRAVFPKGLKIDPKTQKVRTPEVNEIILSMCSFSTDNELIEIESGTLENQSATGGGLGVKDRTPLQVSYHQHLWLLKLLFAA